MSEYVVFLLLLPRHTRIVNQNDELAGLVYDGANAGADRGIRAYTKGQHVHIRHYPALGELHVLQRRTVGLQENGTVCYTCAYVWLREKY